ncbi:MAG: 2,3,4,5-tetrahydropyridine-2,6-dicarboxylate N-succinyltransferase [Pseudomonadota bacterium]
MSHTQLAAQIDAAWERRESLTPQSKGADVEAIGAALDLLDNGKARVAERGADGQWTTHQWLKKAVLLSFRITPNSLVKSPAPGPYWDKVPSKFTGWDDAAFQQAGFRAVTGAVVRRGAFIAKNAVILPAFVNIGAYVDEGAMIDTWATVGSCAQIGRNVHLSGGAGIGGVLEPLQASPTIIEDDCFIGARSEVAEGCIIRQGAVLAMGTFISQSTKIIDRASGEVFRGEVPPYSVVVPGSLPDPKGGPSLACVVIVKRVDAQTRAKTGINELLRD